jgi:hypothetical protein
VQGGREGCEAGGAQRHVVLPDLARNTLYDGHGVVADAIDRKEHKIGPGDLRCEQPAAIVNAAVVMQESRAPLLRQHAKVGNLMSPSTDIESRR